MAEQKDTEQTISEKEPVEKGYTPNQKIWDELGRHAPPGIGYNLPGRPIRPELEKVDIDYPTVEEIIKWQKLFRPIKKIIRHIKKIWRR